MAASAMSERYIGDARLVRRLRVAGVATPFDLGMASVFVPFDHTRLPKKVRTGRLFRAVALAALSKNSQRAFSLKRPPDDCVQRGGFGIREAYLCKLSDHA